METNRVLQILLTELTLDSLKLQEQLQERINDKIDIKDKVINVKNALNELVINELMIKKFESLIINNNE